MNKTISAAGAQFQTLNQVAILVLALALIFIPGCRSEHLRLLFRGLFLIACAALVFRAIRRGRGTETPEGMIEGLGSGRLNPLTTPLERFAMVAAMVATTVLAFA